MEQGRTSKVQKLLQTLFQGRLVVEHRDKSWNAIGKETHTYLPSVVEIVGLLAVLLLSVVFLLLALRNLFPFCG